MGINIKIRKDNLYKEHVYIIGVYISGNKLENDLSPYSLEFILKNNVNVYKFKKKTLFNKVVDADVLKYSYKGRCCLKNINTYYENIKLNLKKHTIEDFAIEIKCRDRKEKSIFQIQTKCIVNEESWVQKRKENGDFFICSDKQLLCRVVPTYTIVKKRLDGIFQRKIPSIKVYISSSYDIMYDILNKLPAPGADAFANDNCIFIISEFGKIKNQRFVMNSVISLLIIR
ncbi:hypothetical protein AGR56_08170 [Clostridium sp. DMHC 10]|uniref:hypothetical protein n=1 Tax=Clostridium sp. DMHC 10 TaxID=747377 RepID=UPI00069DED78|nr:hypothetical protein [Clostridium sp. DMHC 10]KOF56683.1 hypothetical protein AGR56_08170 [Clostridium sp. DMHC 10]